MTSLWGLGGKPLTSGIVDERTSDTQNAKRVWLVGVKFVVGSVWGYD
jgi:hypothetical protein